MHKKSDCGTQVHLYTKAIYFTTIDKLSREFIVSAYLKKIVVRFKFICGGRVHVNTRVENNKIFKSFDYSHDSDVAQIEKK